MRKILPKQAIESFSIAANVYRNLNRPKVDKLFEIKASSRGKRRRKFDFLARQTWRKIVKKANTL